MNYEIIAVMMLGTLIVALMFGMRLAFILGGVALLYGLPTIGKVIIYQFALNIFNLMCSFSMVAVPLFVYMGVILEKSGIAERLYDGLYKLFGPVKGGLAIGTIVLSTLFGACTGTVGAAVITIGVFALSSMVNAGYCKKLASGSVCAGGGLGVIIPPSILLILYGPVAGVSISKLFAAAVIPGLILSISYMTYVFIRCIINPSLAPVVPPEERNNNLRETTDFIIKTLLPFLALILLVLGSIFFGIAAPTEAAAVGAIGGIVLTIAYKRMTLQIFKESVQQTVKITSMVMFVVLGANLFTGVFLRLGGGRLINDAILYLSLGRIGTLVVMLLGIFVLGMFMDWVGLLMILVPIYAPISSAMNFDPIWFGILFCITLQISYMTPPFAYSAFYLKGVAPPGISLQDIYKGGIPFVIIQLLAMILFIIFPELSTWLPNNM